MVDSQCLFTLADEYYLLTTLHIEYRGKEYGETIEFESIQPFVTGKLKAELQKDYEKRNMLKKEYVKKECSLSDVFSNA